MQWGDQSRKAIGCKDDGGASVGEIYGAVRAAEGGGEIHLQSLPCSREVKSEKKVQRVVFGIRLPVTPLG